MASRSRKRTKPNVSAPVAPTVIETKAKGRNKPVGVIILLVVLIMAVWVASKIQPSAPKQFKMKQTFHFSGTGNTSGPMGIWGVAAMGADELALSDQTYGRILIFNRDGKMVKTWGKKGKEGDSFVEPSAIRVDDTGNIWVVDPWRSMIRGFTPQGKELTKVLLTDRFYGPRGIACDGPNFFIADTGSHRIVKADHAGKVLSTWGESRGSDKMSVDNPRSITQVGKDKYYVADYENQRIQVLDPSKGFIQQIKCGCKPSDIAVDSDGRIYVACLEGGVVKAYASNGRELGNLVDANGVADGFHGVSGLAIAADGTVLMGGGDNVTGWKPIP